MIFKNKLLEIKEQCYTNEEIYTDVSKDGEKGASAAILDGEFYQFWLPDNSFIFFLQKSRRLASPSTISNKTVTGATLYKLIRSQPSKHFRARKRIILL